MLKRTRKRLAAIVLAAMAVLTLASTAMAAGTAPDLDRAVSIAITPRETGESQTVIQGVAFKLYRVAELAAGDGEIRYALTEDFADSGVEIGDLTAGGLADHLAAYAAGKGMAVLSGVQAADGGTLFSGLSAGLYLAVQAGEAGGYYTAEPFLISAPMAGQNGTDWLYEIEASPKIEKKDPDAPNPSQTQLTVKKVWEDSGTGRPDSVTISLLRDGIAYDTMELNAGNGWSHTWTGLDAGHRWSVAEVEAPEGYTVRYTGSGTIFTVINTDQDIPDDPESLTIRKVWAGIWAAGHPNKVEVELWNGDTLYDSVELSEENSWAYTWTELPAGSRWRVRETSVPDGCAVTYSTAGSVITVTNTGEPGGGPGTLTVRKVWAGDGDVDRVDSVTVELWDGDVLYDTVRLDAENGWTHTWTGLLESGQWEIRETDVPENYAVTYSMEDGEVVIKNTYLVQTGQLNRPVPVLAALGLVFFAAGWMLRSRRKDHEK